MSDHGVKQLRRVNLGDPPRMAFDTMSHYSRSRRKAPIYWLAVIQAKLRSMDLLSQHDNDTLFKALETYVRPRIQRQLNFSTSFVPLRQSLAGSRVERSDRQIEREEQLLSELEEFRETLDRVAPGRLVPRSERRHHPQYSAAVGAGSQEGPKRYYNSFWRAMSGRLLVSSFDRRFGGRWVP